MLSVSDKYDSVNERNQEISELMKVHIQGVWHNAHKLIRQLAHWLMVTVWHIGLDQHRVTGTLVTPLFTESY